MLLVSIARKLAITVVNCHSVTQQSTLFYLFHPSIALALNLSQFFFFLYFNINLLGIFLYASDIVDYIGNEVV